MKMITLAVLLGLPFAPANSAEPPPHVNASPDARAEVDFPQSIKLAMLERMRRNLHDIQRIQEALGKKDYALAAEVAEFSLGLSSLGPHNARQAPYMPPPMQHLGMEMHKASSRVAVAAQEGDVHLAIDKLSEVTALCVGCHATYRAK